MIGDPQQKLKLAQKAPSKEKQRLEAEAAFAALAGLPPPRVRTRWSQMKIRGAPKPHIVCEVRVESSAMRRAAAKAIADIVQQLGGQIIRERASQDPRSGARRLRVRLALPEQRAVYRDRRLTEITRAALAGMVST